MSGLKTLGLLGAALASLLASNVAQASTDPAMDAQVDAINNDWARIKYTVKGGDAQFRQIDALAGRAAAVVARYPGRAEPLLWHGIVTSEEAAMAGVFRQLGLANSARDILLKAEKIDPKASNGGVAMSLGVLYYKVPGFPIGFGSSDKARRYLQTALAMNPEGLDANFFYADYLVAQGKKADAKPYLDRALRAAVDPHRPAWDAGRRAEVRTLLAKVAPHSR